MNRPRNAVTVSLQSAGSAAGRHRRDLRRMMCAATLFCVLGMSAMQAAGADAFSDSNEARAGGHVPIVAHGARTGGPRGHVPHASASNMYLVTHAPVEVEWSEASRLTALMRLHAAIAYQAVLVEYACASIARIGREQQLPASMAMSSSYRPHWELRMRQPMENHTSRVPPYR